MLLTIMTQGSEIHSKMDNTNTSSVMYHHESIHSGHFMVSDIDDSEVQDDDDSVSVPVPDVEEPVRVVVVPSPPAPNCGPGDGGGDGGRGGGGVSTGYDFEGANKETRNTYMFGHRSSKSVSIDATLSKLFNCMTLAYSCKLTSPRWKNFKGLKLRWKDKIRLNNVIWRAWHMQFIKRKSTRICQFQSPLDTEAHTKPEAVVLEGKYWKRQTQTVRAEYKSWRLSTQKVCKDQVFRKSMDWDSNDSLFDWQPLSNQSAYSTSMIVDDDPFSDINDTLFSCLLPNQPIVFPNSRELAKVGIADLIQPSLVPFQPNLDDCMDTLDWFSDIFSSRLPSVAEEQDNFLSDFLSGPSTSASSNTLQNNNSVFPDLDAITIRPEQNLSSQHQQLSSSSQQTSAIKRNNAPGASVSGSVCGGPSQFSSEMLAQGFQQQNLSATVGRSVGSSVKMGAFGLSPIARAEGSSVKQEQQQRRSSSSQHRLFPRNTHPDCLYTMSNQAQQHQVQTLQQQQRSPPSPHGLPPEMQAVPLQVLPPQPSCSSLVASNTKLLAAHYQDFSNSTKNFAGELIHSADTASKAGAAAERILHPYVAASSTPKMISDATSIAATTTRESINLLRRLSVGVDREPVKAKKDEIFAVPKPKPRSRSRSGPNPGQMLPPQIAQSPTSKRSQLSSSSSSILYSVATTTTQHPISIAPAPIAISAAPPSPTPAILPPNALLARLLTVGPYPAIDKSSSNKSSPTTVAILPNSVNQPAVVMTPVSLATVSTVNDLQSRVLVGATSHVFGGVMSPAKVPIPHASSTITANTSTSTLSFTPYKGAELKASPPSPPKSFRPKSDNERVKYKEHRRVCHINAEQRRRCSIKNGFDTLHHLVPSLNQNPNSKVSKAAMLQKAGEYVKQLKIEREQLHEEKLKLTKQIENLNEAINMCQSQLPATGAPVPCQRPNKMQKMFEEYVRCRTLQNWKFWIFSILIRPLLETYNNTVSTASMEDMCKTVLTWLEQHCSLVALRPVVFNSLRRLSTTTNILSDPMQIQEEAAKAVQAQTT